jgi:uncharacterized protein YijF (DUF1287 family)
VALVLQTDLDQISLDLEKIVVRDVSAQRAKIPMQKNEKRRDACFQHKRYHNNFSHVKDMSTA